MLVSYRTYIYLSIFCGSARGAAYFVKMMSPQMAHCSERRRDKEARGVSRMVVPQQRGI